MIRGKRGSQYLLQAEPATQQEVASCAHRTHKLPCKALVMLVCLVLAGGAENAHSYTQREGDANPPGTYEHMDPMPSVTGVSTATPSDSPALQRLPPVRVDPVRVDPVRSYPTSATYGRSEADRETPAGLLSEPETMQQAWSIALAFDRQLRSRRSGVCSAEQSLQSAESRHWPMVTVDGSYTARSAEPAFRFDLSDIPLLPSNVFPYAQYENANFLGRIDLPLYTSGRIRHAVDAAEAELGSAAMSVQNWTNDLQMQVAGEYVTVLRAQRDVEVAESAVRSLQSHARDVERLFAYHQVSNNDVLAAEVALSNARQDAIQAYNRLDNSRAAYNRRLGRGLASDVRIADASPESAEGDIGSLTAQALRTRPELAQYALKIQALRHRAASLLAESSPQVNLRGEYAFEEDRYRTPDGIAAVGVGVSWNVFDGGRNRYGAGALQQEADSLAWAKEDLESAISLEVRRAWLDIQETRRRREVTSAAVAQAEENLRVAQKRYAAGAAISTEVLDAESLRTQTYRNHHNATYDAVLASIRLRHATGELGRSAGM